MSLESRVESHITLFKENFKTKEETIIAINNEFFLFLSALKKKQLKSIKLFKEKFEESNGFIPESLDFKSVIDLIESFEIKEFNLVDNYNSNQKTLLEVIENV